MCTNDRERAKTIDRECEHGNEQSSSTFVTINEIMQMDSKCKYDKELS